jgi:hypothetical protein
MRTDLCWCNFLAVCAVAFVLMIPFRVSRAQVAAVGGVVIDISTKNERVDIDAAELRSQRARNGTIIDTLLVRYRNGTRLIRLPPGSLPLIARYEASHTNSQFIISADNYLFGASPEGPFRAVGASFSKSAPAARQLVVQYAHDMGIEEEFALALLRYDAYASSIVCDDVDTAELGGHPLVGDKHPDRVLVALLREPQQEKVFRQLFRAYSTPPMCVGEMLLSYRQVGSAPPQIFAHARRWFMGYRWDQEMTILDETQSLSADLPYKALAADLESRWNDYRKAFGGLDELSAIAECLGVLRILRTQNTDIYRRLQREISHIHETGWHGPKVGMVPQVRKIMIEDEWHTQVIEKIGQVVENEVDADSALSLRMYKWQAVLMGNSVDTQIEYPQGWNSGFEYFKKHGSPLIRAKITLASALEAEPMESLAEFRKFFAAVEQQVPSSIGLWLQSLRWLDVYCNSVHVQQTEGHQKLLREQRGRALSVVNARISQILSGKAGQASAARFLEISFGTRLFDLETIEWGSRDDNNNLNSQPLVEFVEMIAKIHQLSIQESLTRRPGLLVLLAHHRYLGYLADKVPRAKPAVDRVRTAILASLNQSK